MKPTPGGDDARPPVMAATPPSAGTDAAAASPGGGRASGDAAPGPAPGDLIKLNLGCGLDTPSELVNVDLVAGPGVDVVHDLDAAPWPWKPGAVSYIKASHVFEHVADPAVFMAEAWRVLAVDGLLDIRVPGGGYVGPGLWLPHEHGFTDPTHRRNCTPHTWDYWIPGTPLFEAYGRGLGGGRGGACYVATHLSLNGEQGEELWIILRKVEA